MSNLEQTLSIIKPDAVERNLQDEIKKNFVENGFNIKSEKKYRLQNQRLKNFIKFINPNHFMESYVLIYHQVQ